MLPVILLALTMGIGSGAAIWLGIRSVRFLEQPNALWPALQQFWLVAHASQGRVWALIPIAIGVAVALIVITVVSCWRLSASAQIWLRDRVLIAGPDESCLAPLAR